jgi:hypothetical protein
MTWVIALLALHLACLVLVLLQPCCEEPPEEPPPADSDDFQLWEREWQS